MNYVPPLYGFHIRGPATVDELQLRRELVAAREFGLIEQFEVDRMPDNDFHIWFAMRRYNGQVVSEYNEHMCSKWGKPRQCSGNAQGNEQ